MMIGDYDKQKQNLNLNCLQYKKNPSSQIKFGTKNAKTSQAFIQSQKERHCFKKDQPNQGHNFRISTLEYYLIVTLIKL